ncbi:MAG: glycosyltransferase family 39 protein [Chloroflexi bacterium]|nr:glycosyltransferase family 39 protein [Chloroflexota bacterium]
MLVLLPVAAGVTLVLGLKARLCCWRDAVLVAAVIWATLLVAMTEALSGVTWLTPAGVTVGWCLALAVGIAVVTRMRAWPRLAGVPSLNGAVDWPHACTLGALVGLVAVLACVALISPPNTWDSMTYHMARLIHWQQDASVVPYRTNIVRQLYLQPGAEYILLHLQLLSGGDRFAGLVQWGAMLGSLLGVTLLAAELGAGRAGALCASIVAASLPIGVLESTSTQNDYVVAFWLVCTALFGTRLVRNPGRGHGWLNVFGLGAATGLALLTKATAYLFVLPILVWVAVVLMRRSHRRSVAPLVLVGAIALLLNVSFYARNMQVFGSPTGPADEGSPQLRYLNDAMTPALFASNAVRDLGLNFIATPFSAVNVRALNAVRQVHVWSGVDLNDPRTTWGTEMFAEQPAGLAFDENRASNPIQLVLLVSAFVAILPLRKRLNPAVVPYAASLACAFVVFAALLRWQPWHTRLELPLFILGAPLVGIVVERVSPRFAMILAAGLLLSMLPWVIYNQARPLVGPRSILFIDRTDQYFTNRPGVRQPYEAAAGVLRERGCSVVGFVSNQDGWEYPLRALLPAGAEIDHVGVTNLTAGLGPFPETADPPCAIMSFGEAASARTVDAAGRVYRSSWTAGSGQDEIAVLTPDGQ